MACGIDVSTNLGTCTSAGSGVDYDLRYFSYFICLSQSVGTSVGLDCIDVGLDCNEF